jgi:hypothetical protein
VPELHRVVPLLVTPLGGGLGGKRQCRHILVPAGEEGVQPHWACTHMCHDLMWSCRDQFQSRVQAVCRVGRVGWLMRAHG